MAGALKAIYDRGKTFTTFYTSGAGGGIGLLFVAPKTNTPDALASVLQAGVTDPIYNSFPLAYKTFFKHGPFTQFFRQWSQMFKRPRHPQPSSKERSSGGTDTTIKPVNDFQQLLNDSMDFWFSAATPSDVNFLSTGLCAPFSFLEEAVSIQKLRAFKGDFLLNAFCITSCHMELFDKSQIDSKHFEAALSFPFIYPPCELNGKLYFEGSAVDPLNFPQLVDIYDRNQIDTDFVVLIDVLGALEDCLIRKPRNIVDAYGISILTPIVSLAKKSKKEFEAILKKYEDEHRRIFKYTALTFDIPHEARPFVTDWSITNLNLMWETGYKAGEAFVSDPENNRLLPDRLPDTGDPAF